MTKKQLSILGILGATACLVLFTLTGAIFMLSSSSLAVEPARQTLLTTTATPTNNGDEKMAKCILHAFEESEYGDHANLTLQLMVDVNKQLVPGLHNTRRIVRTEDPAKQIWIVEAMYDFDAITPSGKHVTTEVWQEALVDISTGMLTISQENRRAYVALGGDPDNLRLDLNKYCLQ